MDTIGASDIRFPDGARETALTSGRWEAVIEVRGLPTLRVVLVPVGQRVLVEGDGGFPAVLPGDAVEVSDELL